jgi:arylsulfatase A-like enzyme
MTADIFPTVCRLTGAALPQCTLDGRDIWPVITEGAKAPHSFICWTEGPQRAIRKGPWKLVLNGITHDGTPQGSKPLEGDDAVFLSNVESDPGESRNLRHEHPEIVDEMQTELEKWLRDVQSP